MTNSSNQLNQCTSAVQYQEDCHFFDVEGTGFRISPKLFTRHPSTLPKLLSSLSSDGSVIGRSMSDPVLLYGHTADQFSLFLHALSLQTLPHPLQLSLDDLISVAELAYRYDSYSLKTWALNGLTPAVMLTARDRSHTNLTSEFFIRILRLALSCNDERLANMVQSLWTDRIHLHNLPPAPAIAFAEKHGLMLLQIHAYYAQLLISAPFLPHSLSEDAQLSLTASQRAHLLEGYYSLSSYWNHLRGHPLPFERSPDCSSHDHRMCISAWRTRWAVMADWPLKCEDIDVLRRLKYMEMALERDRTLRVCMSAGCRERAIETLGSKMKELGENLWHHFDL